MVRHRHSFGRESAVSGLLGAGAVALWFLVLDAIAGHPFSTPSILGQVILFGSSEPVVSPPVWSAVVAYTGLHLAIFFVAGMVTTWLVFLADRHMIAIFALVMLAISTVFVMYGLLDLLLAATSGQFPFWKVFGANLLAGAAMGWYLLKRHPGLRRLLHREPLGAWDQ